MTKADLHFYFDPVCPFAWMTSKWVRQVAKARDYSVEWRFVSLRFLNANVDYDAHFPSEYLSVHEAGVRLLRVAARTRAEVGPGAVDSLQAAFGAHIFDVQPWRDQEEERRTVGSIAHVEKILKYAGLPLDFAESLDDPSWDAALRHETDEAVALAGKDVGTPIIHVDPPTGAAFFGPVISRRPTDAEALELWDHVLGLARFEGFSELKRSLREFPRLQVYGVGNDGRGAVEDWHQGSRRPKK